MRLNVRHKLEGVANKVIKHQPELGGDPFQAGKVVDLDRGARFLNLEVLVRYHILEYFAEVEHFKSRHIVVKIGKLQEAVDDPAHVDNRRKDHVDVLSSIVPKRLLVAQPEKLAQSGDFAQGFLQVVRRQVCEFIQFFTHGERSGVKNLPRHRQY